MHKIWYIDIKGKQEGPFSVYELQRDIRVTLDTLVWKEGFDRWKPIREVPELKEIFSEEENPPQNEPVAFVPKKITPDNEIVLDYSREPPNFVWLLIALSIILYMVYRLYAEG